MLDYILPAALTGFCYLLFPFMIIVFKIQFDKSLQLKWLVFTNCLIIFIFFSILQFYAGIEGRNVMPACIWGFIAYSLLKNYAFTPNKTIPKTDQDAISNQISLTVEEVEHIQTSFDESIAKVSSALYSQLDAHEDEVTNYYYVLFEYNILQYFCLATLLIETKGQKPIKQVSDILQTSIYPYAEFIWQDNAPKIISSVLKDRFDEYSKLFCGNYKLNDYSLSYLSILLGPSMTKNFIGFVNFSLYYFEHKRIPCLADLKNIEVLHPLEQLGYISIFQSIAVNLADFNADMFTLLCNRTDSTCNNASIPIKNKDITSNIKPINNMHITSHKNISSKKSILFIFLIIFIALIASTVPNVYKLYINKIENTYQLGYDDAQKAVSLQNKKQIDIKKADEKIFSNYEKRIISLEKELLFWKDNALIFSDDDSTHYHQKGCKLIGNSDTIIIDISSTEDLQLSPCSECGSRNIVNDYMKNREKRQ